MATLSDEAYQSLLDSLSDIHYRANRLYEWREFGLVLERLRTRFDIVRQRLDGARNSISQDDKDAMLDALSRCQDTELIDIHNFIQSVQYIGKPLTASNNGSSTLVLEKWMADVEKTARRVDDDLQQDNHGSLREQVRAFWKLLSTMGAERQRLLEREIGDLRSFSLLLHNQLGRR